jgi:NAD(P)-dependent dehydrogenase (short-subunit alcohol dehydrogenase family)
MTLQSKPNLVITGSEGLIGRELTRHFENRFSILRLDLDLGHDLTSDAFVSRWFAKNRELYGMIVAHAFNPVPTSGAHRIEPIDVSLDELRRYFEVNSTSVFNVCRHFIGNNTGGSIVNISSLYGVLSPRHDIYRDFVKPIGYSLSKAAVIAMGKYMAAYYAPQFRFNTVVLGGVSDPAQDATFVSNYSRNVPMGRLMKLNEVLSVFDFLLDDRSSYVTGSEVVVDGGWTAW